MQMLIAGRKVDSVSGQKIEIKNPATCEVLDIVPRANGEDVCLAIQSAIRGRDVMREVPAHERSRILRTASDQIAARHEELSQLL